MRFATYNRKSVYSDRSDSVKNQAKMCRDFAEVKYPGQIGSWKEYQDEGFTGANAERPQLQRLLDDVGHGRVDVLVVYQLDRISRNIRDFADIYGLLESKGVKFISVKENLDTESPMGRAMIYITMVFAQMERETIAERVTDNMYGLAKRGYWTGGRVPVGYQRKQVTSDGKKHWMLEPEPEAAKFVDRLFDDYLGAASLSALVKDYQRRGVQLPGGRKALMMPIYRCLHGYSSVEATKDTYRFFRDAGCDMSHTDASQWDGTHAVLVYGRSPSAGGGRQESAPSKDWQVCVGCHEPIVDADRWLRVQKKLGENQFGHAGDGKNEPLLLAGIITCKACGRKMRQQHRDGGKRNYYQCTAARHYDATRPKCPTGCARADVIDKLVLDFLRTGKADEAVLREYETKVQGDGTLEEDVRTLSTRLEKGEAEIGRLAESLAAAEGSIAQGYIIKAMEKKDAELQELRKKLEELEAELEMQKNAEETAEKKKLEVQDFFEAFDSLDAAAKNRALKKIIRKCEYDGKTVFLSL